MPKKHAIISEDAHSFLVHDGEKHFAIAKRGVAEDLHERIRALPKYAVGGVVESGDAPEPGSFEAAQMADKEKGFAPISEQALPAPEPGTLRYAQMKDAVILPVPDRAAASVPPAAAVLSDSATVSPEAVMQSAPAAPAPQVISPPQANAARAASMSPIMSQLDTGIKLQKEGAQMKTAAETGLADEQAKFYQQQNYEKQAEEQRARLAHLQEQQQNIELENKALYDAAMNNKIDPNRVYNNMSTGDRVLASIALILGGAGSGGDPAKNAALQVMNKAIDRDIDSQMKAGENARNLYQINLQKYRDTSAAIDATRMQMTAIAQGQLAGLTAKYGGKIAQANGQALMGTLDAQQASNKMAFLDKQSEIYARNAEAKAKTAAASQKNNENYLPGYGYAQVKPTDKDRETLATAKNVTAQLSELQQRAAKIGTTVPGSAEDKVNKTKVAALQLQLKNAYQLGVLSESDMKMLNNIVADPGSLMTGRTIEQLEATKQSMNALEQSTLQKLGVQGAAQQGKISFQEFQKRKKEGKL